MSEARGPIHTRLIEKLPVPAHPFKSIINEQKARDDKTIRELAAAAKAFQELNACYRVGKQPSEALFNRLKKAKKALENPRIAEAQEGK